MDAVGLDRKRIYTNNKSMVRVAKGLKQSYTNAIEMSLDEVLVALKTRTDCYEVLNDTHNRIYLDIDGKVEGLTEEQFAEEDTQVHDALTDYLDAMECDYCLMSASSYLHHKISWRVVTTTYMCSKEDNKNWAKGLKLNLPDGVKIDLGVYDKNRKMRMLGSNKDGENRPLRLIKGEPIDTITSYIEGCTLKELPKTEVKRGRPPKAKESKLLPIFDLLPIELIDDYETWIKIGMITKNSDEPIEVFKQVSSRSVKYNERECEKKWETFAKGGLTVWKFLKEYAPDVYERVKQNDYAYMKEDFETTHFKVMNPYMIIRMTNGGLQQISQADFINMYRNLLCDGECFTSKWLSDPTIRTYEKLCFMPKQQAPANEYNIFSGFPVEAVEGDVSVPSNLLRMITGNDDKMYNYVEKWVAWILQKPYEKTGVVLVNQGSQGVGKDTYFDFVGRMFGTEYFMNTGNAENDVWGRFTDDQQRIIFMKFEEATFVSNKTHAEKLKSLITSTIRKFEGKGLKPITLNNYVNLVMTTNQEVPVLLEDSDRRFCCFKASDEKRGDFDYWKMVHTTLNNPATKNAYYYHLMNIDLTGFNPREFPKTEYYETIREALAPHHARYFQRIVEDCLNHDAETQEWDARKLYNRMKEDCKFDLQEKKFGLDMKKYPEDALAKKKGKTCNKYTMNAEKMMEYLKSKNWWVEL